MVVVINRAETTARQVAARKRLEETACCCGMFAPSVRRQRCSAALLRQAARVDFSRPYCMPVVQRRDGTAAPINKLRGFIEYERKPEPYRPPAERKLDYLEINSTHEPLGCTGARASSSSRINCDGRKWSMHTRRAHWRQRCAQHGHSVHAGEPMCVSSQIGHI